MAWAVIEQEKDVHIVPLEDLLPHFYSADCRCTPTMERQAERKLYTHHAYDQREVAEQAKEMQTYKTLVIL